MDGSTHQDRPREVGPMMTSIDPNRWEKNLPSIIYFLLELSGLSPGFLVRFFNVNLVYHFWKDLDVYFKFGLIWENINKLTILKSFLNYNLIISKEKNLLLRNHLSEMRGKSHYNHWKKKKRRSKPYLSFNFGKLIPLLFCISSFWRQ